MFGFDLSFIAGELSFCDCDELYFERCHFATLLPTPPTVVSSTQFDAIGCFFQQLAVHSVPRCRLVGCIIFGQFLANGTTAAELVNVDVMFSNTTALDTSTLGIHAEAGATVRMSGGLIGEDSDAKAVSFIHVEPGSLVELAGVTFQVRRVAVPVYVGGILLVHGGAITAAPDVADPASVGLCIYTNVGADLRLWDETISLPAVILARPGTHVSLANTTLQGPLPKYHGLLELSCPKTVTLAGVHVLDPNAVMPLLYATDLECTQGSPVSTVVDIANTSLEGMV